MKQGLMMAGFLSLMVIAGCRKDIPVDQSISESTRNETSSFIARPNQCRLTFWGEVDVYGCSFKYNDRSLVREWKIDYYDGLPDIFSFKYDNQNHLKSGNVIFNYNGTAFDFKYQYQGNRLVKETWYIAGTNTIADEIVNTYNFFGQIIKRKSITTNTYATFTYDFFGNNPLIYVYTDGVLVEKEEYTYRTFNRDPLTVMNGLPVVLSIYDFVISNRWETSEKITVYDAGVPEIITDIDPNTSRMTLGPQFLLDSVSSYDRISQETSSFTFDYEDCGGTNTSRPEVATHPFSNQHSTAVAIAKFKRAMGMGHAADIKKEIKALKQKLKR